MEKNIIKDNGREFEIVESFPEGAFVRESKQREPKSPESVY